MARLPPPVTMITSSMPLATASSTLYWMAGLSTKGSISLGCALVAGRNRVPSPAAVMIAFGTAGLVTAGGPAARFGGSADPQQRRDAPAKERIGHVLLSPPRAADSRRAG